VPAPANRDAREAERSSAEFCVPADHALCACWTLPQAAAASRRSRRAVFELYDSGRSRVISILALHLTGKQVFVVALIVMFVLWTTAAKSPRRRCRNCHELNREHADFCSQCGEKLTNR